MRTVFAMAVAASLFAAVSGTAQSAPIAPLPGVITDTGGVTPVHYYYHRGYYHRGYYHRHWRHCYWRNGYRRCW
jgi:hypothetical protein